MPEQPGKRRPSRSRRATPEPRMNAPDRSASKETGNLPAEEPVLHRVRRTVCPVCKTPVETRDVAGAPNFPCCSRRCKLIDLGKWLNGEYRIPQANKEEGEDE